MRIENTALDGVKIIHLDLFSDDRGGFAETYDVEKFSTLGIHTTFVQDSWSHSAVSGTVRGFHFQLPPRAQHKLVRVTRGQVYDVVVDLRRDSETFGRHVAFELDAREMTAVLVPIGFAHGFCSLCDDVEITYKMSDHFSPEHYTGLSWCDPELGIDWPVTVGDAVVSEKDSGHPRLKDLPQVF